MNTSIMVKTALIAALTAVASQVAIPLGQIPITLQAFFPLLAGAVLGPVYGALSQIIYVLMGSIGLPVFAGGHSGFGVLVGPSGGYLFGFIAAAYIVGLIIVRGRSSALRVAMAMGIGVFTIYLLGVIQLAIVAKITIVQAIIAGAAPFILVDLIKAAVAAEVARRIGFATDGQGTN